MRYILYQINYDLNQPGQDYSKIINAIESLGPYIKILKSTWVVDVSLTAEQIYNRIEGSFDKSDKILVSALTKDRYGWLDTAHWDWINSRG